MTANPTISLSWNPTFDLYSQPHHTVRRQADILLLGEPTNLLDMESIESLNTALEGYPGTLILVSHDREFVSSLATRIIELTPQGVINFSGNYEEYLESGSAPA
ncbi:hypothetical protein [Thiorhodovibrio frisius]|uniref:ATPase component of ABC transporters with duplicated ATPase domain n=1 Tax=Thiorhodovibrio frisius TaxID=631362 RepID=H8Z6A5_9GAMM|nr:hypothetical protein Thi970DRAFT_04344 [Thiorhodovibrio frisius]WPL21437.1 ABC transporter ATP-binding protein uup [Thiorhodovibrio frisius]